MIGHCELGGFALNLDVKEWDVEPIFLLPHVLL